MKFQPDEKCNLVLEGNRWLQSSKKVLETLIRHLNDLMFSLFLSQMLFYSLYAVLQCCDISHAWHKVSR